MLDKKILVSQWLSTDENILTKFTKNVWLLDKIFGWTGLVMYKEDKEKAKRILYEVYWYENIYQLFSPELDEEKLDKTLTKLFRFQDLLQEDTEKDTIF